MSTQILDVEKILAYRVSSEILSMTYSLTPNCIYSFIS